MRIYEINFGTVLPSSGRYQSPKRDLEYPKKKLKKKTKDEPDKKPVPKGRGQIIDINV